MARPPQEAIDMFVSITGASEAVAVQKLEAYGGDLNEAVNSYFNEGDGANAQVHSSPIAREDFATVDDPMDVEHEASAFSLFQGRGRLDPFSLTGQRITGSFFDRRGLMDSGSRAPRVSHPREVREIPIDFKDVGSQSARPGPIIEDITGSSADHGPEVHGTVAIEDDDDKIPTPPPALNSGHTEFHSTHSRPSAPTISSMTDANNEIEEQMILAAIEASKKETQGHLDYQFDVSDVPSHTQFKSNSGDLEETEIERAVSLSLKAAEQENVSNEQTKQYGAKGSSSSSPGELPEQERMTTLSERQEFSRLNNGTPKVSIIDDEESEDIEEEPLVRHRSRQLSSGPVNSAIEAGPSLDSISSHPEPYDSHPHNNGSLFHSDEWGGISSLEHDEAVMLEAAIFGGVPERSGYHFEYSHSGSGGQADRYSRLPRSPSPTLAAQRLIREQQDDEYLAALQEDREKELKAIQEAELRRLEAAAAREAAFKEEQRQKEESHRRLKEEEEVERLLAAKQASLPQEPLPDDENAVTFLFRMPDGSRCGRRFLKSDKLRSLIDFLDTGRMVKPGTYRLVRPYPRRVFGETENELSLDELGLTSKQEALFLELI